jgi:DNA replication protein DnaT
MALNWLKVQRITPDKPEIAILARKLRISQAEAFLSWFRVYSWADEITSDGRVPNLSLEDGDRMSRCCPGTCAALASKDIGWIETKSVRNVSIIEFKNWSRHNGESAKKRALAAEKKRKQREICPQKTGTNVPSNRGPDKRREDKNKKRGRAPQNSIDEAMKILEQKNGAEAATSNGPA